jgi:Ser/Thr protein kinase RdoA (MazF antagonist)
MNTLLASAEILALVNAEYSTLGRARNCKLLRRGFNDSYLVGIGPEWYIFRVYLNQKYYIESSDAFKFELELLDHLSSKGIPVAPAKKRDNGELLGWTTTTLGERAFAMFSYAAGDVLTMKSVTPNHCLLVGKTAAELHLAANSFQSKHSRYHLDRKYLIDEPLRIIAQQYDESQRTISKQEVEELKEMVSSLQPIEELAEAIHSLDVSGDEFGIIHSDLHPGNIHFTGNRLTLFDFDHCAYGWRAYELAITEYMPDLQKAAVLEGYESVRPLTEGERACIPVFAKLRRLWDIGDSLAIEPVRAESIR